MEADARATLELELARNLAAGEVHEAATRVIRGYGPEILGFLVATMRNEASAEDVFSLFCEDVLKGLPGFGGRASFRTWSYTLARNAAYHYRQKLRRRTGREQGFGEDFPLSHVAAAVRTETAAHLRTAVKSKFAALRDTLPEDEQTLLILRIDKKLEWRDIALVLLEGEPSEADVKKESARLRKRFQIVKEKIVELGKKEGLVP
jgi:RNA polymerase sigma-70 factor, ECF subfamily